MTASTHLTEVLTPLVAVAGYDLEDLRVSAAGKRSVVRVVVDKDGGVTLDDVADISRVVSDALDREDEADPTLLGTSYVLEVSSPGVDRPLTHGRHWRRNVGRLVVATLREGLPVTGRITAADDDAVTLDVAGTPRVLPYADVAKGLVQVEFSRAAEPEDADDLTDDDEDGDDT
jgi:ribosome maturation factor RimP